MVMIVLTVRTAVLTVSSQAWLCWRTEYCGAGSRSSLVLCVSCLASSNKPKLSLSSVSSQ